MLENVNDNVLSVQQTGGPSEVQNKLLSNPEYKQLFADEIERLMFNGGVLTAQVAGSIFSLRASELNVAIIGESARWGDNRHSTTPYTAANRNANVQTLLTIISRSALKLSSINSSPKAGFPRWRRRCLAIMAARSIPDINST